MPPTKLQSPRTLALTLACRRDIDLFEGLPNEYYYPSISLCATDAVFSVGASKASVQNVIRRVVEKTGIEIDRRGWMKPDPMPLAKFLPLARPEGFFGSKKRTSTKDGVLKGEAVAQVAEALVASGVNSLSEFQACDEAKLESVRDALCKAHGQSSGLSWAYFRNLAGDESQVMVDRYLMGYVERETTATLKVDEVVALVQHVTNELRRDYSHMTPRLLAHLIWRFESGREGKSKRI